MSQVQPSDARVAYDAMAPIYDEFNAGNNYELWLGEVLLPELEKYGLRRPGRALDLGCGTGRAFEPLLRRRWSVWGVDASERMLEQAREKLPDAWGYIGEVELRQHDARDLPTFERPSKLGGPHRVRFDLIIALNDVVNYLTEDGDLERVFSGMKANLWEDGLVCFDATSLAVFHGSYTHSGGSSSLSDRGWQWLGLTDRAEPGGLFEAELSGVDVEPHVHRLRHWPREQIEAAMGAAGLQCLAALGQREEGRSLILEEPDESVHERTIYIGGHRG
jgi:SAM-dependent methyltransferase